MLVEMVETGFVQDIIIGIMTGILHNNIRKAYYY